MRAFRIITGAKRRMASVTGSVTGLLVLALVLLTGCNAAPQAQKYVIGLVSLTPVLDPALTAFKAHMRDLGYFEDGPNANVRYVYAREPGTPTVGVDKVLDKLTQLMGPDVDLVASMNTAAVQKLKELSAASNKPIIFMGVWDPIAVTPQIVPNLSHPGGNITGVRGGGSEFKRVEWFKRIVPGIKRLYAPYREIDPGGKLAIFEAKLAGAKLGIEFVTPVVTDNDSITAAFNNIPSNVDGIWLAADGAISSRSKDIAAIAIKRKLPLSGINPSHALDGALFSFGYDIDGVGVQGARIADQVIKGLKAGNFKVGDVPIETADFPLLVNLDTARSIGVTVPDDILEQANRVIRIGEIQAAATPAPAATTAATSAATPGTSSPTSVPAPKPTAKDF